MIKGKICPNDSKPNEGLQSFFVGGYSLKLEGARTEDFVERITS